MNSPDSKLKTQNLKLISVILPTYNEAENIREMIQRINRSLEGAVEIIVVDDDSPDRTWAIVEKMEMKNAKLVRRIGVKGLASAIARGIAESTGEIVAWLDCDLSMPPETLPQLVQSLSDAHIAVASRYATGGKDLRPPLRTLTSKLINFLARIILRIPVRDCDSGYIAARKSVFDAVPLITSGYGEYCIDFLHRAAKHGFIIKEIPYTFTDRSHGTSKTTQNLFSFALLGFRYVLCILKLRFIKIK
ncbi:MAG: polyprenol monophosphomannose synthase [bacterium]